MSIIEEIKQSRQQLLNDEQKKAILRSVKEQLITERHAIVDGAPHYRDQEWGSLDRWIIRTPYKCHAAISEWLEGLGFKTSRYYNRGGIDNGMKVWF